ncbi:hypothetical protein C2E23DRAFT_883095 [Lenzites betulinus]|nr:hypothetical protein C2E23DRAFT_883095 [Lenzites betulinus]
MSSAPLFLYERLQHVFHAKIRDKQAFVLYKDLPRLVRPYMLRSSVNRASPFRTALRDALAEELFLGRIDVDVTSLPIRVLFTPTGLDFYGNYCAPPPQRQVRARNWRHVGPSRSAAINEYANVVNIITSIQETISLFNAEDVNALNVMNLIETVRSYLQTEETLCSDNSDLTQRLNDVNVELGVMRKEMEDIDASTSDDDDDDEGYSLEHRSVSASIESTDGVMWAMNGEGEAFEVEEDDYYSDGMPDDVPVGA